MVKKRLIAEMAIVVGFVVILGFVISELTNKNRLIAATEINYEERTREVESLDGLVSEQNIQIADLRRNVEELEGLRDQLAEMTALLAKRDARVGTLERTLANRNRDLASYEEGNLSIRQAELLEEIALLKSEIFALKRERTALAIDDEIFGVECTGSMKPTITCDDLVRVIKNSLMEELKVGTILVFRAPDECGFPVEPIYIATPKLINNRWVMVKGETPIGWGPARILHRVESVGRDKDGEPYFITKGDANDRVDSCRIRKDNIVGHVVEILHGWGESAR